MEVLEEKKYIFNRTYERKDGTIGSRDYIKTYKANGRTRGRPRTEESILIAEIKKLSDESKRKVSKYVEKIKKREKEDGSENK